MIEPLVPPEVDLRDYDYIPLYGDRLFNSDTWAYCDADEKVAALRLWWRAWHEEPAGSLPNNDRLLAERAGYGVAVKAFLVVKENAMRGWILCSDGRLYHPVVASIALDVWQTKKKKKAENAADRERKRLKRLVVCPPEKMSIPPDIRSDNRQIPPDVQSENALKGREEIRSTDRDKSLSPSKPALRKSNFEEFWAECPRKVGKAAAQKSYLRALRQITHDELIAGMRRYAEQRAGQDPQFTVHPATWLNQGRWADEQPGSVHEQPTGPTGPKPSLKEILGDDYERAMALAH